MSLTTNIKTIWIENKTNEFWYKTLIFVYSTLRNQLKGNNKFI